MHRITTGRLVLAPYHSDDIEELAQVMGDPQVMQHIGNGALSRHEVSDLVARVVASWAEIAMGWWTIRLRESGQLIGQIGLRPDKDLLEVAVGYAIAAAYWRKGYMSEALESVIQYGFNRKGLTQIFATVRPENHPSRALLLERGFTQKPDIFIRSKTLCVYVRAK